MGHVLLQLEPTCILKDFEGPNISCWVSTLLCMIALVFTDSLPHLVTDRTSSMKIRGPMLIQSLYLKSPSPFSIHSFPRVSSWTDAFSGAGIVPYILILSSSILSVVEPQGVFTATWHLKFEFANNRNLSSVIPALNVSFPVSSYHILSKHLAISSISISKLSCA